MVYESKPLNFGIVILSPEHNIGRLKTTMRSLRNHYEGVPVVCITGQDATTEDVKEMKEVCPTFRGKKTITSLMNTGIRNGHKEWNIFVMEGCTVRSGIMVKYSRFIKDEKDIIFSIVMDHNRDGRPTKIYSTFEDATLNGITIHQKTWKKIGAFTDNPLEVSKKFWALQALDYGCTFKGILGTKII